MRLPASVFFAVFVLAITPRNVFAEESDGAYGRLDGDLLFTGAAGAGLELGGPQIMTGVALSYLSTAGLYARYADALGQSDARFARSVAAGLELRPLFLGRYALDLEQGPAHLDLFLDSLSFCVGAVWADDARTGFGATPGLEVALGLSFPILPEGSGPFLGVAGVARWHDRDLSGVLERDLLERGSMLLLTVAWHQIFDAGLVDVRDTKSTE